MAQKKCSILEFQKESDGDEDPFNHRKLPKELITLMYQFPSPEFRKCGVCNVTMPQASSITEHYKGKRHKSEVRKWLLKNHDTIVDGWPMTSGAVAGGSKRKLFQGPLDDVPDVPEPKRNKDMAAGPKFGHCNVCNIDLTSTSHANDHYAGKRHKKNVLQRGREGLN